MRRFLREFNERTLALVLERRFPKLLGDRLITAVELADVSRSHILSVLDATNWVIAGPRGAAVRLGMKRSTLNFRMKKLGIVRYQGRAQEAQP